MRSNEDPGNAYDTVLSRVLTAAKVVFGRHVAADDNFFDLGGDSISAVELTMLLGQELGAEPDVADLIAAEDIAAFALALVDRTARCFTGTVLDRQGNYGG